MITIYGRTPQGLRRMEPTVLPALPAEALWIDLLRPDGEEQARVEAAVGIEIPSREELAEIEISSRLFSEGSTQFMTATLICRGDTDQPYTAPVTFILATNALITIRYDEPRPFATFPHQAERHTEITSTALDLLAALLDAIIDRTADILEFVEREVDALSHETFNPQDGLKAKTTHALHREALRRIGRNQMRTLKARESLVSVGRLVTFLSRPRDPKLTKRVAERLKTLSRDIASLTDHTSHLGNTMAFLLNAVLGHIQNEQNAIIKIFSVVAVAFLPPTLIASIYGMNFRVMPELGWTGGYPLALCVMIASAVIPLAYFRHRGWL